MYSAYIICMFYSVIHALTLHSYHMGFVLFFRTTYQTAIRYAQL